MSVGVALDIVVSAGSTWDKWHSVKIMGELETLAMLNRILSKRGTITGYQSVALANAIFHFKTGWIRVDGSLVHWRRNEAEDQILFAFLNESKKGTEG
jgi:hypothetical protein